MLFFEMFSDNISKGQLLKLTKSHFLKKIKKGRIFLDTLYYCCKLKIYIIIIILLYKFVTLYVICINILLYYSDLYTHAHCTNINLILGKYLLIRKSNTKYL